MATLVWYVTARGVGHAVRSGLVLAALRRLDGARGVARRLLALLALTPGPLPRGAGSAALTPARCARRPLSRAAGEEPGVRGA